MSSHLRGRVARDHTCYSYFAKAIEAGAELIVAVTVLLGSPPESGLILNLVMFLEL